MLCFLCKQNFDNLKFLLMHFKRKHDIRVNDTFRCCELNCNQNFQNLNSFKKHMNRKQINSSHEDVAADGQGCSNIVL